MTRLLSWGTRAAPSSTSSISTPDEPSYAEIATRMGRSIGGIGPLRGRCLERLRGMIGDDFR